MVCAVTALTIPFLSFGGAFAAVSNTGNGIRISPVRTDVSITQGASKIVQVTVTNMTGSPMELQPIENDFIAGDEQGHPAIILDQDKFAPTHSLKRFMMPIANFKIKPGETRAVNLEINVPPSAQAGGYFGAIRFLPVNKTTDPQVVNSSVASWVLLTVPGPTTHELILTNFDIKQKGKVAGNFDSPNGINLGLRFENKGNIQEAPFGQVQVLKGDKLIYSSNFNQTDPKDEVLPDSARSWDVPLKNLGKFGKYTVSGVFSYANGKSIQVKKTFWIIPRVLVAGVVGAIIVLLLIFFGIRSFLRSYKRRILRAHR
jgi:hypothetical protein